MKLSTFKIKFTSTCPVVWFTLARNRVTRDFNTEQVVAAFEAINTQGF